MRSEEKGWRDSHRELTAPESYVLVYGPKVGGSRPFKLALMELVAGKHLTLTNAEDSILFGFWKRSVALLAPGARHRSLGSRSLPALLDLLGEMSPRTTQDGKVGVPVAKFARKVRRKYGWLGGYAETEVMSGLVSAGSTSARSISGSGSLPAPGRPRGPSSSATLRRAGGSGSACGSTTIPHKPSPFWGLPVPPPCSCKSSTPISNASASGARPKAARTPAQREAQRATIPQPDGKTRSMTSISTRSTSTG